MDKIGKCVYSQRNLTDYNLTDYNLTDYQKECMFAGCVSLMLKETRMMKKIAKFMEQDVLLGVRNVECLDEIDECIATIQGLEIILRDLAKLNNI